MGCGRRLMIRHRSTNHSVYLPRDQGVSSDRRGAAPAGIWTARDRRESVNLGGSLPGRAGDDAAMTNGSDCRLFPSFLSALALSFLSLAADEPKQAAEPTAAARNRMVE